MLEGLLDIFTGGGAGGILGTIGSLITKGQERKLLKVKLDHELDMMKYQMQERQMEIAANSESEERELQMVDRESERDEEVAKTSAFEASIQTLNMPTGIKFVDSVRSLMRPFITVVLMSGFAWILFEALQYNSEVQAAMGAGLVADLVRDVTFLACTSVTWWFGSRWSSESRIS